MENAKVQPGGLVRELDGVARIVLPKEWRDSQGIGPGTALELIPGQGGVLLIRRYVPAGSCLFCGGMRQLSGYSGKRVCERCRQALSRREALDRPGSPKYL